MWTGDGNKRLDPGSGAAAWSRELPDAEIEIFEGTGSLPHAETPALFWRALQRFIAGLPESD